MEVTGHGGPLVEPWGLLFGEPECSLWVAGPAAPVLATLAEVLGEESLRVSVAPDGRSFKAKPRAITLGNLANLVLAAKLVFPPVMTVVVAEEGPPGTRIDIDVRGSDTRVVRMAVPRALSRAVNLLEHRGMRVNVGPWQRRTRRPRPS